MQNEQPFADVLSHIGAGRLKEALDRLNDVPVDIEPIFPLAK